jgi:hypothetical protein
MAEGFVMLHPHGRYALYNQGGICHDLQLGDRLEVDLGLIWLEVRVKRDIGGYYLNGDNFSMYPKRVYARLMAGEGEEGRED